MDWTDQISRKGKPLQEVNISLLQDTQVSVKITLSI